jgi:hypothetical protein
MVLLYIKLIICDVKEELERVGAQREAVCMTGRPFETAERNSPIQRVFTKLSGGGWAIPVGSLGVLYPSIRFSSGLSMAHAMNPVHFRNSQPPRRSHSASRSILVWFVRPMKAVTLLSL